MNNNGKEKDMRRKDALLAGVMGGVVGAVLVMVVGMIAPIGAHNEHPPDAEFGEITCRGLRVISENDGNRVIRRAMSDGGYVMVYGVRDDGNTGSTAQMWAIDDQGFFSVTDSEGNIVSVVLEEIR